MKNLFKEILWIVALSSFIALIYNFASTKSVPLIPKTIEERTVSTTELLSGLVDEDADESIESSSTNVALNDDNKANIDNKDTLALSEKKGKESGENKDADKSRDNSKSISDISLNKGNQSTEMHSDIPEIRFVNYEQVKQLIGKAGVQFIDARIEDDYKESTIANAINIHPWKDGVPYFDEKILLNLPRNRTYIIFCSGGTCTDSHDVANKMFEMGFTRLFVYHNGWDEWEKLEKLNRSGL